MENKSPSPPPKPVGERVRQLRQRRAQEGITELRGVFVPTDLHAEAKKVLRKWMKERGE